MTQMLTRTQMNPGPESPLRYVAALDGLRCVAVGLVLVYHAAMPLHVGGNVGVDVFFVLSGYLITSLLLAEWRAAGTLHVKRFYLRRMIRLYPPLLLCIAVITVPALWVMADARAYGAETVAAATYLMPAFHVAVGGETVWYHMWTLAIEEWFYLVWPLALIVGLRRLSNRALALTAGGFGLAMLAGKIILAAAGYEFGAYLRAGGLLLGAGLALWLGGKRPDWSSRWAAAGFGCLGIAVVAGGSAAVEPYTYLLAAVGTALMIPTLLRPDAGLSRVLSQPALVWLGQRSYEIYLWHYPVLVLAALAAGAGHNRVWWWAVPLSLALAFASHRITGPISKRWKAKVPYLQPASAAQHAAASDGIIADRMTSTSRSPMRNPPNRNR